MKWTIGNPNFTGNSTSARVFLDLEFLELGEFDFVYPASTSWREGICVPLPC